MPHNPLFAFQGRAPDASKFSTTPSRAVEKQKLKWRARPAINSQPAIGFDFLSHGKRARFHTRRTGKTPGSPQETDYIFGHAVHPPHPILVVCFRLCTRQHLHTPDWKGASRLPSFLFLDPHLFPVFNALLPLLGCHAFHAGPPGHSRSWSLNTGERL